LQCSSRWWGMPYHSSVPSPAGGLLMKPPCLLPFPSLLNAYCRPGHSHAREPWRVIHACGRPPCASELMTGSVPVMTMDDS
jgi:hypothetical protein